jgi:branched-chain amino acid transport system ATP-binding protein
VNVALGCRPTQYLSPVLVGRVLSVFGQLGKQGTAVLLVEQLLEKALALANRVYAISQGKIVLESTASSENLGEHLERAYSVPDVIYPEPPSA